MKFLFFLSTLLFLNSSHAAESEVWALTTTQFKDVKVNGLPLKKSHFWEFSNWSQIETENSEAMLLLSGQYYFKIHKHTLIRWHDSGVQLLSGRVYIKNLSGPMPFQIPGFFNFKITTTDMIADFDKQTKRTEFEILSQQQNVQIDSDDREIPAPEGTRLVFKPEYVDGEIAYDFLLNDRKIPKMHMEKTTVENLKRIDVELWKAPLKVANITKKKITSKAKADLSKYICKSPKGTLNACLFVKEKSSCVRYSCNLSGDWTQRTPFEKNDLCPTSRTVKSCEWLGR